MVRICRAWQFGDCLRRSLASTHDGRATHRYPQMVVAQGERDVVGSPHAPRSPGSNFIKTSSRQPCAPGVGELTLGSHARLAPANARALFRVEENAGD